MELQFPAVSKKTIFLVIHCLILAVGFCGGPLVSRLYFRRGGKRVWLTAFLETGGCPIMVFPLLLAYILRRRKNTQTRLFYMNLPLFLAVAVIGALTGVDDYLYAYGVAKLPVSTSSLIIATQLAFTAVFAYFLVKQRFTAFSVNSVVLLTLGAVVLGLHTSGDRPAGESSGEYLMGFFLTAVAAVLYGLILPLIEMTYQKNKEALTYTLIMEIQFVMCFFASAFCVVGMFINNDFQAIARESRANDDGQASYYLVLIFTGIIWQCFFMGAVGIIFYGSSLLSAIVIAMCLPMTELLSVIFYSEPFKAEKGISLFLSIWGFCSYFYGEMKSMQQNKMEESKNTLPTNHHHHHVSQVQIPVQTSTH